MVLTFGFCDLSTSCVWICMAQMAEHTFLGVHWAAYGFLLPPLYDCEVAQACLFGYRHETFTGVAPTIPAVSQHSPRLSAKPSRPKPHSSAQTFLTTCNLPTMIHAEARLSFLLSVQCSFTVHIEGGKKPHKTLQPSNYCQGTSTTCPNTQGNRD